MCKKLTKQGTTRALSQSRYPGGYPAKNPASMRVSRHLGYPVVIFYIKDWEAVLEQQHAVQSADPFMEKLTTRYPGYPVSGTRADVINTAPPQLEFSREVHT